ncbi:MAG TPA: type II secretion system major pseudopilin GspG [Rhodanobacteraceae bacterium]|nr:type II secretion system major pseudopilin GspG [Rhodanobacteraceae bacterium]
MSTNTPATRIRRLGAAGFTLIEMLAVIVLIGIVASIVVTKVGKQMNSGKYKAGKAQLASLSMKIENYALDNGSPPSSLQALVTQPADASMWNGPYAKESEIKDPFGHAFGYKEPGEHGTFDLIFYGKDGQPGGTDPLDKDVGNWQ